MEAINAIRDLISKGALEKALFALRDQFQKHQLKDNIIALSARYNLLEEKRMQGLISTEDTTVEENKITYSLLSLLNKMDEIYVEANLVDVNQQLDEPSLLKKLLEILEETYQGFRAQARIRDRVYYRLKERLDTKDELSFEAFFHKYYSAMNQEELDYHNSIREYTKNVLNKYNRKALELLLGNTALHSKIPKTKQLEKHLLVWLGKFERLFEDTPSISLIYVGVDEMQPIPRKSVPFPMGIEHELRGILEN